MAYWLGKTEPHKYAWADLIRDGRTRWDGVRNYQARNNLNAARPGDGFFLYHSQEGLAVMGLARVDGVAYPDPSAEEDPNPWVCLDIRPDFALAAPLTLAQMKADPVLREMAFVRQSRLSVSPVTEEQAQRILELTGTQSSGCSGPGASCHT